MSVLTNAQINNLNRDPISDPIILLVEFEEEHSGTVHRYCHNNEDIVSNGDTYLAASIGFSLPAYGEELRGVSINVSNVDRRPGRALIRSQEPIMVRLMAIDYADPDTLLIDTLDLFQIGSADIDAESVDGRIVPVMDFQTPVPFFRTTKQLFPALWG